MTLKIRQLLIYFCFVAFGFFLYLSCRHAAFIWDDQFLVVKNPLIRSPILCLEAFRHFLGDDPPSIFYRPVQTLTYMLDYWRGGIDPIIYHDGSVLIHGLNAILLSVFIKGILKRESQVSEKQAELTGVLVALVWLAHPIHSATVAYIAGRADSLALMFLLAGWCFWDVFLKSTGKRKSLLGCLVGLCGFLAICSKEAALIGIGIFIAWVLFASKEQSLKAKMVVLASSLAIVGFYLCLRLTISPGEVTQPIGSQGNRLNLVIRALGDYFRLLVFPDNLRMERQIVMVPNLFRNPASFDPLYPYLAIPGILFVLFLGISAFLKGSFQRVRRFGVFWFLAAILPVSNVFVLNATIAEHWLYIPSIGVLLVAVGWILQTSPTTQKIFLTATFLAIVGLTIRTKMRVNDWASPIVFFESTMRAGGDTARIRVNLANEYQLQGNLKKGEDLLRSVLALSPDYAQAKHALVVNLTLQGRREEARALYGSETNPFGGSFRGQLYRLQNLTTSGKIDDAQKLVKELKPDHPDSWLLTLEIGRLFEKLGQPQQKESLYRNFAESHWWHSESHVELARLHEMTDPELAAENYLQAARLDVRDTALQARAQAIRERMPKPGY